MDYVFNYVFNYDLNQIQYQKYCFIPLKTAHCYELNQAMLSIRISNWASFNLSFNIQMCLCLFISFNPWITQSNPYSNVVYMQKCFFLSYSKMFLYTKMLLKFKEISQFELSFGWNVLCDWMWIRQFLLGYFIVFLIFILVIIILLIDVNFKLGYDISVWKCVMCITKSLISFNFISNTNFNQIVNLFSFF